MARIPKLDAAGKFLAADVNAQIDARTKATMRADLPALAKELKIGGGSGIEEVSGTVTLDASGPAIREVYATGAATVQGEKLAIFDAAMKYKADGVPLVVLAGKEYGTGSSRDWAAKGTNLLGVRAVIVESFERIHRSNLVGMGVLPLQYQDGESAATYSLDGSETFSIDGVADIEPRQDVTVKVTRATGETFDIVARCRIDTYNELEYFRSGGILQFVLRNLAA